MQDSSEIVNKEMHLQVAEVGETIKEIDLQEAEVKALKIRMKEEAEEEDSEVVLNKVRTDL